MNDISLSSPMGDRDIPVSSPSTSFSALLCEVIFSYLSVDRDVGLSWSDACSQAEGPLW